MSFAHTGYISRYEDAVADKCEHGMNEPCDSSCDWICSDHHKNIYKISDQVYDNCERDDNVISVLWSDREPGTFCEGNIFHELCDSNDPADDTNVLATVVDNRPVIQFLKINGNNRSQMLEYQSVILAHETAHTMKMAEVYDNIGHDIYCIMHRYSPNTAMIIYEDVMNNKNRFCASCTEAMIDLTNGLYYKGN